MGRASNRKYPRTRTSNYLRTINCTCLGKNNRNYLGTSTRNYLWTRTINYHRTDFSNSQAKIIKCHVPVPVPSSALVAGCHQGLVIRIRQYPPSLGQSPPGLDTTLGPGLNLHISTTNLLINFPILDFRHSDRGLEGFISNGHKSR